MTEIKIQEELFKAAPETINPSIRGNYEAGQVEAKIQIGLLEKEYLTAFRSQAELVLLSGDGEATAAKTFEDMGFVTVNAQEVFDTAAKVAMEIAPSNEVNMSSFIELNKTVSALSRAVGVSLPKPLEFENGLPSLTLADNMRNLVRGQFGGAGCEPAWVLFKACDLALKNRVSLDPLPVIVYNAKESSVADYQVLFTSVNQTTMSFGDPSEVKNFLKELTSALKKQGKIKQKKTQEQNTKGEEQ